MESKSKKYSFAVYLRATAALMIMMCHFASKNQSAYSNMMNQFFAVGVGIFFILSGFLFGTRGSGITENVAAWYKRRIRRIYIPLWLYLLALMLLYILTGKSILNTDWIWLALGLAADLSGIVEARHTWFITALILCYFLTPFLERLAARVGGGT